MKKQHRNNRKPTRRLPRRQNTQKLPRPVWAVLRSFFGGGITVAAALCAEALLFANTNLPLHLVRPAACAAASLGALVTGFLAAGAMPKMKLLGGFGAGIFYVLCVLASAMCTGDIPLWNGDTFSLLTALLLGGMAGGAASALWAPRRARGA